MKKEFMNTLRKGFYLFDLLVLGSLALCIEHTMLYRYTWEVWLMDIALLLRLNSTFLLYRRERLGIFLIAVFTILFGYYVLEVSFNNTFFRMEEYPSIVLNTQPTGDDYVWRRYPTVELGIRSIVYWSWLMPILAYAILFLRRKATRNEYRWYDLAGLAIFKDRAGRLLLTMMLLLFIAYMVGYQLNGQLSFYALMSLPLVAYYHLNRYVGRKAHWLEYVILAVGLFVFDQAQYEINGNRIMYLAGSGMAILCVCVWMLLRTKKVTASLFALVMAAVVLPGLSIGYNIYQSLEGARSINYVNIGTKQGYMYIRRYENVDGKQKIWVGIRDRYRTTVPCQFRIILPDDFYSPFAKCTAEDGKIVVYNIEKGYILKD